MASIRAPPRNPLRPENRLKAAPTQRLHLAQNKRMGDGRVLSGQISNAGVYYVKSDTEERAIVAYNYKNWLFFSL